MAETLDGPHSQQWGTHVRPALIRWCMFTITLSIVPLAFAYFAALALRSPMSLLDFMGQGEPLLVAATFSFAGVGELAARKNLSASPSLQLTVQGLTAVVGFAAALLFAFVFAVRSVGQDYDQELVGVAAALLCVLSLTASICCVTIANHIAHQPPSHDA